MYPSFHPLSYKCPAFIFFYGGTIPLCMCATFSLSVHLWVHLGWLCLSATVLTSLFMKNFWECWHDSELELYFAVCLLTEVREIYWTRISEIAAHLSAVERVAVWCTLLMKQVYWVG